MKPRSLLLTFALLASATLLAQQPASDLIQPTRPVTPGLAPRISVKLLHQSPGERVFAVIFSTGDEVISGLTGFATQYHVADAHFTAIGAVNHALLAWFDPALKLYHPIPVDEQVEVLSFLGDIATYNGKPIVHAHSILGRHDGSTIGGHTFELHVQPTLEVFITVNDTPLRKRDDPSGLRLIDPSL